MRTRTRSKKPLGRRAPKSKRNRGNTKNRCFRESVVSVRLVSPSTPGWVQYNAEIVPRTPASNGLVRFRTSTKWCDGSTAPQQWHHIPYIDKFGQIHATSVARWRCSAPQLLATITSTVFKRLWGRTRRGPYKYRPNAQLLYQVAQYYAITNDDSFFRRFLAMLCRHRFKEIRKFVYYNLKHLDANNRFLYDQALHGALWFQSRLRRSPRRVLSNQMIEIQRDETTHKVGVSLRCHFDKQTVAWARVYSGPDARPSIKTVVPPLGKGQSVFRGYP